MGEPIHGIIAVGEREPSERNREYAQQFLALIGTREKDRIRRLFSDLEANRHKIIGRRKRMEELRLPFLTEAKPTDPIVGIDTVRTSIITALHEKPRPLLESALREHIYLLHRLESRMITRLMVPIREFIRINQCEEGANFTKLTMLRLGLQKSEEAISMLSPDGMDLIGNLINRECRRILNKHGESQSREDQLVEET